MLVMPDFPATGKKREAELQAEFEKALTPDDRGIKDFLKAVRLQNTLYFSYPFPKKDIVELKEFDYAFDLVQQATKEYYKDFKKYQTDLLNSEIEQFNMSYLKMMSTGDILKQDLEYIHEYSYTIIKLLEPIIEPGRNFLQEKKYNPQQQKSKAKTLPVKKTGGPTASFMDEDEQLYEEGGDLLRINIYVFTPDKKAYSDSFYVYWMTSGMYTRFMRKEFSLDHLENNNKIPKMASTTGLLIEPGIKYCFVAVPKSDTRRIVAITKVNGDEILEYSGNPDMTALYAVPLYVQQ